MFRFTIRDVLWLPVVVALAAQSGLQSQDRGPLPAARDPDPALTAALKRLKNDDVDWRGTTFGHAGPKLASDNARRIAEHGVDIADELLPLLDDKESFIAAHVLLTELWRVPDRQKERISTTISTGFFLSYNGLVLKLEWKDREGQEEKTVTVQDETCQHKRLRDWWKARYKDHPAEFSPKTVVE